MLKLFLILVALPAVAVLGHDIFMFTQHQDKGFMLSAVGFLWTTYNPDSYKWVNENVDEQTWAIINLILAQKSIVVFGGFAALVYLLTWIGTMIFKGKGMKNDKLDYLKKNKKGKIVYKRK